VLTYVRENKSGPSRGTSAKRVKAFAGKARRCYDALGSNAEEELFKVLADNFNPDPGEVLRFAEAYAVNRSPQNLVRLSKAAESPRQELLRRLNRADGGRAHIVKIREAVLERMRSGKQADRFFALDPDLEHVLGSWFNPGFLTLAKVDWTAPAMLLEKIIHHEAVHAIDGWSDLRRRLQPDRRCFAFFHPALPDEPLIFVEVALLKIMPAAIAPLLARETELDADLKNYKVATFYSISNCQPGLKGVNLGNFLIKRVAEALKKEFPKLVTFCTLSPIPSLTAWLAKTAEITDARIKPATLKLLNESLLELRARCDGDFTKLEPSGTAQVKL
jgi:malonyl-CoA decarboxylase